MFAHEELVYSRESIEVVFVVYCHVGWMVAVDMSTLTVVLICAVFHSINKSGVCGSN